MQKNSSWLRRLRVARAYLSAMWPGRQLPPGTLVQLDLIERLNRYILLDRAKTFGPVFKATMQDRLVICAIGGDIGRRLLREHAEALQPVTIQLESLVPHGFIRQMQGETHRRYRRQLVGACQYLDLDGLALRLEAAAADCLAEFAASSMQDGPAWSETLSAIATGGLLDAFFGVRSGEQRFDDLTKGYHQLGPHGIVANITPKQVNAFQFLSERLRRLEGAREPSCLLGRLAPADETMLGNLIYMVELGRYDLRSLFRWISKYAAENPDWLARVASESGLPLSARANTRAFALEVLRLEQSERLMRNVRSGFVFDGFHVPRGALVRVCMWEMHKDAAIFPAPFAFNPSRFVSPARFGDAYSPFGMDHHQCPLSSLSTSLAMAFLTALASRYTVEKVGLGRPVRGPYHWEPGPDLAVRLRPRIHAQVAKAK
jgi:cytochrome P450